MLEDGIVSSCLPVSLSVNVVSGDEVYSLVYYMQQEQQLAEVRPEEVNLSLTFVFPQAEEWLCTAVFFGVAASTFGADCCAYLKTGLCSGTCFK